MEFLFAVAVSGSVTVGITYLISRFVKYRAAKYVPSLLLLGGAVYLVIYARFFSTNGFADLIMGIWSVLLFFTAVIGFISAIVIDSKGKKG